MSATCPYLLDTVNSTGHSQRMCITEMVNNVFPNAGVLIDSSTIDQLYEDLKVFWMIVTGTLSFFMQLGFTMLEVGMVAKRNVQTILFKNIMDSSIAAVAWLCIGYGFAWGSGSDVLGGFLGENNFWGKIAVEDFAKFFYTWSFCATSSTIVSGSVAERCTISGYFIYTTTITAFIYPVVCHWLWTGDGWLSPYNSEARFPAIDFSGAMAVHMVGGCCALMGAIIIGPRRGRFPEKGEKKIEFGNTNVPMVLYGTIILWYGWYGFNCGATLAFAYEMTIAIRIALMNTFSAGTGGITVGVLMYWENQKWNVPGICNGIIGGLVSVTGSCHVINSGAAIMIGVAGGFIYFWGSKLLVRLKIDDPLDASIVHGLCGAWGGVAAALFAEDELVLSSYKTDNNMGSTIIRLANNLLAIFVIAVWSCGLSGLLFYSASRTVGLRTEHGSYGGGLDMIDFGMPAYKDTEEHPPEGHDDNTHKNGEINIADNNGGGYQTLE